MVHKRVRGKVAARTHPYVGDDDVRFVFDEDELESKMRVVFKDLRAMASEGYADKIEGPQFAVRAE